jgi:hypothetical protein
MEPASIIGIASASVNIAKFAGTVILGIQDTRSAYQGAQQDIDGLVALLESLSRSPFIYPEISSRIRQVQRLSQI